MRIPAAILILTALLVGCKNEVGAGGPLDLNEDPGGPEVPTGPQAPEVFTPIEVALSAPGVRVLSAPEYRNTVRDLLGIDVSPHLTQSDWTAGFDNGAGILIDDNLFAALVTEADGRIERQNRDAGRRKLGCLRRRQRAAIPHRHAR